MGSPGPSVVWRQSAYDERRHAFHEFGEAFSEALCEHSAPNAQLTDGERAVLCVICVLVHGAELTEQHGDRGQWK
ncbi:hypothetical protein GCM10027436_36020 [Actinophytocola sediminis]